MSDRFKALAALLVVTVAFSGCLGDDATPQQKDDVEDEGPEARATSSTGSLSGRVFSFSLLELPGATVELAQDEEVLYEGKTNATGGYVINQIAPGEYFVTYAADGYRSATKPVTITTGVVTQLDIRLPDESDTEAEVPYVVRDDWVGMISCGAGFESPRVADFKPRLTTYPCANSDPNNDQSRMIHVQPGLRELVVGLTWSPVGGATGRALDLLIMTPDCPDLWDETLCYQWIGGEPDLVTSLNDTNIDPVLRFSNITEETAIELFVAPPTEETPDVLLSQDFHLYYEAYYHQDAPEGRNPIASG